MTKPDRQKLSILLVLLAVLGLVLLLGYRMNQPTTTAAVQISETKTSANPPAPSDARIRLDLVEKPEGAEEDVGKRNVFQYRPLPVPPSPAVSGTTPGAVRPSQPVAPAPVQYPRPGPPPPPPPPSIPLKYQGYLTTKTPSVLTAALVDDTRPNDVKRFNVNTGEVLMGRYRITSISDKSVEVEDLEYHRRQTLPLLR